MKTKRLTKFGAVLSAALVLLSGIGFGGFCSASRDRHRQKSIRIAL